MLKQRELMLCQFWAAWYITRLRIKFTPKGVVFSFCSFHFLLCEQTLLRRLAYVLYSSVAGKVQTRAAGCMYTKGICLHRLEHALCTR